MVSPITQLNSTQYRIDCLTTPDITPFTGTVVHWLLNGAVKSSTANGTVDAQTYNNSLLVHPDGASLNVTCVGRIENRVYTRSVVLHGNATSCDDNYN